MTHTHGSFGGNTPVVVIACTTTYRTTRRISHVHDIIIRRLVDDLYARQAYSDATME